MAFAETPLFYFPQLPLASSSPASLVDATFPMNSDGDRLIFPIIATRSGTIDQIEFRAGAGTLDPSSVVRISLQDLGANGSNVPDGIQDQFRDIDDSVWTGSDVWIQSGLLTDDGTDGGTKRTVSYGDRFGIVFEFETFVGSNSVGIKVINVDPEGGGVQRKTYGYAFFDSGVSLLAINNGWPIISIKYSDGSYQNIHVHNYPITATGTKILSGNVEAGLKFTAPVGMRVSGGFGYVGTEEDIRLLLYDSDENLLAFSAVDVQESSGDDSFFSYFGEEVDLKGNATYYLVARREGDKTTDGELHYFDVESTALLDSISGGSDFHYVERADHTTDSFVATTTRRPWLGLVVKAIDPTGITIISPDPVSVTLSPQAPSLSFPQIVTAPRSVTVSLTEPLISNSKPIPDTIVVSLSLPVPLASITGKKIIPQPVSIATLLPAIAEAFLGAKVYPDSVDVSILTVAPALQSDALQTVTPDVLTVSLIPSGIAKVANDIVFEVLPVAAYIELPFPTIVQAATIPSQLPIISKIVWIIELTLDDGSDGISISRIPAESIQATDEWLGSGSQTFIPRGAGSVSLTAKVRGFDSLSIANQALTDAQAASTLLTRPGLVRLFRETQFHNSDLTKTDGPFLSALVTSVSFRRNPTGYKIDLGSELTLTQAEGSYKTHILSTKDLAGYDGGTGETFAADVPVTKDRFIRPRDIIQISGGFTVRINSVSTNLTPRGWTQNISSVDEVAA